MKTRNEKILVALLVLIVFVAGNFYGFRWLSQRQQELDLNRAELRADQAEAEVARDNKMEVLEQSLDDVQAGPGGTKVSVELKVKGPTQGLCEWLANLQKPENFYAVSQLSLKVDPDQKSMICTLQLARYFKNGS